MPAPRQADVLLRTGYVKLENSKSLWQKIDSTVSSEINKKQDIHCALAAARVR